MQTLSHHAQGAAQLVPFAPAGQKISVIMANYNGQAHIRQSIQSVLKQTHRDLELIVVDDDSEDDSCRIVREIMENDHRVRLVESATRRGPASARNLALSVASGAWIAVTDADDLLHPERFSRLLYAAGSLGTDIVADDLIFFGDVQSDAGRTLLQQLSLTGPEEIDAYALVGGTLLGVKQVSLGYLKPLILRSAIGTIRYNETLTVDEDHDFYLRLLMNGARFMVIPEAMYLYRRHCGSLSHRYNAASLREMIRAQEALLQEMPESRRDVRRALRRRLRNHRNQLRYARAVETIKARRFLSAGLLFLRDPRNWPLLAASLQERRQRKLRCEDAVETVRTMVLCLAGEADEEDFPGCTIINVPEPPGEGWQPSAASIWARLSQLATRHEPDVIALGRAGQYALGLLPSYRSARVVRTRDDLAAAHPDRTGSLIARNGICAGNA